MTDKRQSDALHLAGIADDGAWTFVIGVRKEIAAELRRQYAEIETLRTGYEAARMEIESLRAAQPAGAQQPGAAYAALPEPALSDDLYCADMMRAFADATHTLRAESLAAAYCEELDKLSQRNYELRLASLGQAPASTSGDFIRRTNEDYAAWCATKYTPEFNSKGPDLHGLWAWQEQQRRMDDLLRQAPINLNCKSEQKRLATLWGFVPAQATPAYKDSTPELHIGDSAFESWYSTYSPAHKSDKQRARDAYAAGMGDPLVTAAPAAVAGPSDPSITLDFKQATELLKMFGGEPGLVTLQHGNERSHSGGGLYAWYSDLPEEGAVFLGAEPDDEAAPTTQPAPQLPERDANVPAERQGLFRKFDVRRVDGSDQPGGKHHGCRYFVLDVDHDQHAHAALTAYAAACESSHPELAADLRSKWGAAPNNQPAPEQEQILYDPKALLEVFQKAQAGSSGTAGTLRGIAAVIASWESRGPHTLIVAPQPMEREPLSDEKVDSLCKVGPVYAPEGKVTRTPTQYKNELEAAQRFGLRKGEHAHGIKGGQHGTD